MLWLTNVMRKRTVLRFGLGLIMARRARFANTNGPPEDSVDAGLSPDSFSLILDVASQYQKPR